MKAIHILTLIFVALLLHSISKDYVKGLVLSNYHGPPPPRPPPPLPPLVPRHTMAPPQDEFPTTLPTEIQQPQQVPQPMAVDVGGSSWDDHHHQGAEYQETLLDSQDQFKDVISAV